MKTLITIAFLALTFSAHASIDLTKCKLVISLPEGAGGAFSFGPITKNSVGVDQVEIQKVGITFTVAQGVNVGSVSVLDSNNGVYLAADLNHNFYYQTQKQDIAASVSCNL